MKELTKDNIKAVAFSMLFTAAILSIAYQNSIENDKQINNPKIVIIDGCEYIFTNSTFGADRYEHKSNCKNHKQP